MRRARASKTDSTFQFDVPYFDVDGEFVWGATAMTLAEFIAMVNDGGD